MQVASSRRVLWREASLAPDVDGVPGARRRPHARCARRELARGARVRSRGTSTSTPSRRSGAARSASRCRPIRAASCRRGGRDARRGVDRGRRDRARRSARRVARRARPAARVADPVGWRRGGSSRSRRLDAARRAACVARCERRRGPRRLAAVSEPIAAVLATEQSAARARSSCARPPRPTRTPRSRACRCATSAWRSSAPMRACAR